MHVAAKIEILPHPHIADVAELRIAEKLVDDLIAQRLLVKVWDGEDYACGLTAAKAVIWDAIGSTDMDRIEVYDIDKTRIGWVMLVWGNSYDVIGDYTQSLRDEPHGTSDADYIGGASDLAEKIAMEGY